MNSLRCKDQLSHLIKDDCQCVKKTDCPFVAVDDSVAFLVNRVENFFDFGVGILRTKTTQYSEKSVTKVDKMSLTQAE